MKSNKYCTNLLGRLKGPFLTKLWAYGFVFIIFPWLSGCSYYRVKPVKVEGKEALLGHIQTFNQTNKYILLHQNGASYHLKDAEIDEESFILRGQSVVPSFQHLYPYQREFGKTYRFKKSGVQMPLDEVHVYLNNSIELGEEKVVEIPFSSITELATSNLNGGRSVLNVSLGVVGTMAALLIIVALTKSSCPFLYVQGEEGWVYQGELYPGNIIPGAQQTDMLRLPDLTAVNGEYHLEIANELKEIQHTDLAVLQWVDHAADLKVLADPQGNLHSVKELIPPVAGAQAYEAVKAADNTVFAFDALRDQTSTRRLNLRFDKQSEVTEAKLYLRLKNSLWLDYLFGKFNAKFGSFYPQFQARQQDATFEEASLWKDNQKLPLQIQVKTATGWEQQAQINAVGPMGFRELVVPLDLSQAGATDFEVRLETGFMFWELDQVAVDFSEIKPLEPQTALPISAIDAQGEDIAESLSWVDGDYAIQASVGESTKIRYPKLPLKGEKRTLFLKNRGFYTYVRNYKGIPDLTQLKKFRQPQYFTDFSYNTYRKLIDNLMQVQPEQIISYVD